MVIIGIFNHKFNGLFVFVFWVNYITHALLQTTPNKKTQPNTQDAETLYSQ